MREFKVRAWDKERKVMVYPDQIYPKGQYQIVLYDICANANGLALQHFDTRTKYEHDGDQFSVPDWEDVESCFMQYTGIKDRNGREIYEGDILEYKKLSFRDDGHERGFVEYNEYAEWSVNNWLLNRICRRAEVIGNRFENPELLEEQNV
ncbi:phage uncharacterized protein TIGR01671 [Aneurinibacillus thermoaerophilus]|uniref:Phage uncharacterized protein TIGR01671 n=1 Tax=Aneurinibacillus thermoaerophilus TaxID=143495 RepID=A0A1G8ELL6_ANETH|nr:YopX family protein [Aneurinibacillus thermoaerophilus]SDH70736.1 phage uncharacterized protein TIGR01671 [Aneurinibacillus thermoaerophilus]